MGRGGRSVTQRSRFVLVVPHVAFSYSTGVEHCGSVRYCLRFRLDFPKNNCLVLGVSMNEAVPAAPSSVELMAKQGCEKLGLESFDALVRRARTCRRFDESMRVPREFLLELAELAHLAPCGANAQRLRFHVVSDAEECSSLFEKLTWAGALKDWSGPVEGERPTGYIAILAERPAPGKPAAPITEADAGIAAQTMMLAARSATPEVAACMFKAFPPRAIDVMGLDGDKYEVKLIMVFGVPAETQVIDAIDSNPDGSINYWRDEAQVHHVPKRPLADVLV